MLRQRRRRCASINPPLVQRVLWLHNAKPLSPIIYNILEYSVFLLVRQIGVTIVGLYIEA